MIGEPVINHSHNGLGFFGHLIYTYTSASPSSMERWEQNLTNLKKMLREKVEITKQDLQDFFNLSDARMKELGLK